MRLFVIVSAFIFYLVFYTNQILSDDIIPQKSYSTVHVGDYGWDRTAVLLTLSHNVAAAKYKVKEFYDEDLESIREQRRKKPFCNAFTGCGRKRSDDSMTELFEVSQQLPEMEELNEEILPEVKLWETIQKAHLDSLSKKQKEQMEMIKRVQHPMLNNYRRNRCGKANYYYC
ncbi:hypothetical protein PGB90_000620 [Kerria lacca]